MKFLRAIPALAISLACIGSALPAQAAVDPILVNGDILEGSIITSKDFTVDVFTNGAVEDVSFILDGQYLGMDKTYPYQWNVNTVDGKHELKIRVDDGANRIVYTPEFSVKSGVTSVPTPTPTPTPNPAPTPPADSDTTQFPVSVNGKDLNGSTLTTGRFKVDVAASNVKDVSFVLDGVYLGADRTAPYQWDISTADGSHDLKVRVSSASGRIEYRPSFTVQAGISAPTPPPAPTEPPVLTPPPVVVPPISNENVINVDTTAELETALQNAVAGQTIVVADGSYNGDFNAINDGTPEKPITLTGSRNAILSTGSISKGYGLHMLGDYWRVNGISVTSSAKGIVLDGATNAIIDGVDVGFIGAEAVHFRKNSSDGAIINSVIHDTGITTPQYGEGIYLGSSKNNWGTIMGSSILPDRSDRTRVQNNRIINTSAEGIDIKEGTSDGVISGNTFLNSGVSGQNSADSWVDVKGNNYLITENTGKGTLLDAFQAHVLLTGWGNNNTFLDNTVEGGVPGYEVWIQQGITGTYIKCDTTLAIKGLSNIACKN